MNEALMLLTAVGYTIALVIQVMVSITNPPMGLFLLVLTILVLREAREWRMDTVANKQLAV